MKKPYAATKTAGLPLAIGALQCLLAAGPIKEAPAPGRENFVVKLTDQFQWPNDFQFTIPDFSVPTPAAMRAAVELMLSQMLAGKQVYVGCWGGMGRTGLVLAIFAKVMFAYQDLTDPGAKDRPPVDHVRQEYWAKAVEHEDQHTFIAEFDPTPTIEWFLTAEKQAFGFNKAGLLAVLRFRLRRTAERFRARWKARLAEFRARFAGA